jgi:hypothetical protein
VKHKGDMPWFDMDKATCVDSPGFAFYGQKFMSNGSSIELNVHPCNKNTEKEYSVKCASREERRQAMRR